MKKSNVLLIIHDETGKAIPGLQKLIAAAKIPIVCIELHLILGPKEMGMMRPEDLTPISSQVKKKGGCVYGQTAERPSSPSSTQILLDFIKKKSIEPQNWFIVGQLLEVCIKGHIEIIKKLFKDSGLYLIKGCVRPFSNAGYSEMRGLGVEVITLKEFKEMQLQ